MIYDVWSEADPMETVRHTDDALTDNPPMGCYARLDELAECARCGRVVRMRDGYPSLDLHVAITARSGYRYKGDDYPALICLDCAREEGQEVSEPATDAERIEALERNVGRLVGAMREVVSALDRRIVSYVVDENGTVAE